MHMEPEDESIDDRGDPHAGMGLVFWILFACGILGVLLILSIPW